MNENLRKIQIAHTLDRRQIMLKKLLSLIFATACVLALWGCTGNRDAADFAASGNELGSDSKTGIAYVGSNVCIDCHQAFSWSAGAVNEYLEGKHVIHSDHITAARGSECLKCHDPIGDGPALESYVSAEDVPAAGLAVVGCETCHGAGGEHFGSGPMPVGSPNFEACGVCHNAEMFHNAYHPEGDNILEDYKASPHAASGDRNNFMCVKCHTDEGGRAYKDVETAESLAAVTLPLATASPIQCRTCHDPHNPMKLLKEETENHRTHEVTASAEYNTCTNCHQRHDAQLASADKLAEDATDEDGASGDLIYHSKRWNRVISSTHYDNPNTSYESANLDEEDPDYAPNIVEGYAMDPANERVCRDCHNVHASDITINEQWANSGHGGRILKAKKAAEAAAKDAGDRRTFAEITAIRAAGPNGDESPMPHYDWDAQNRQSCQRCHTATGVKNFAIASAAGIDYEPTNNDFSHLEGWAFKVDDDGAFVLDDDGKKQVETSSGQNEMIYCWACHDNNSGEIRNPGAITEEYDELVTVSYPDISKSNICMSCHLGRETGEVIKVQAADAGTNKSFINSHYLSAGGQLFGETGYEYEGKNYENVSYYAHDQIGMGTKDGLAAWEAANGASGPCVGCHLATAESHLFQPVERDEATGKITAIMATVCVNCHSGGHGPAFVSKGAAEVDVEAAADFLNTEEEDYNAALEALKAALAGAGIHFGESYPYFFKTAGNSSNANALKDWTSVDPGDDWRDAMGAAFNLNLLLHDPGGYAHNRYYVKRLIWDSIDYADNGILDDSVVASIQAQETAGDITEEISTAAQTYLGATRPGDPVE